MRIELGEIDYYVKHHESRQNAWYLPYCQESRISPTRQEVVQRLCRELCRYQNYPLWNKELVESLFTNYQTLTDKLVVLPVVGSETYFDANIVTHQDNDYLIVDLLNIADYTSSVNEMCYILHNLCHVHILRYLFQQRYEVPSTYAGQLGYRFFTEGFVQYLSWNEDVRKYRMNDARYMGRKKEAWHMLKAALHIEGPRIQEQVLLMLSRLDLWERFPDVAGMFYCDQNFQEGGAKQLKRYFDAGFQEIYQTFHEAG